MPRCRPAGSSTTTWPGVTGPAPDEPLAPPAGHVALPRSPAGLRRPALACVGGSGALSGVDRTAPGLPRHDRPVGWVLVPEDRRGRLSGHPPARPGRAGEPERPGLLPRLPAPLPRAHGAHRAVLPARRLHRVAAARPGRRPGHRRALRPSDVAVGRARRHAGVGRLPVLQIAYAESLACLVVAGWLWLVVERRWLGAGALALLVGLSRPIAAPLCIVLAVAFVARWRRRDEAPLRRPELVRMGASAVGAVLAVVLWPAIVAWRTGVPDAFTQTQAAWRADHAIQWFSGWLSITEWALRDTPRPVVYAPVLLTGVVAGLMTAVLGPWARRLGPELRAWSLAYPAYLAVAIDPFTSVFRFALPLFSLGAVLIGGARPEGPSRWWVARTAALVVVGIALQVLWIDKLLVFHPPTDYPP